MRYKSLMLLTVGFFLSLAQLPAQSLNVVADSSVTQLIEQYKIFNRNYEFTDGYRIQISFTDVREDVYKHKADLYKKFPELRAYVEYEQPYYKLRVGDFQTRMEASYYLQMFQGAYPGAFIVKDKVYQ